MNTYFMVRKYDKPSDRINIEDFVYEVTSGSYTVAEICEKFNITPRQIYYLCGKMNVNHHLRNDRTWMKSEEFRKKISNANRGKIRSENHKQSYRDAASKRVHGNNRKPGTYNHSNETKRRIRESNKEKWNSDVLPEKWITATIENPDWHANLSRSLKGKIRTREHTEKLVSSKVGMPFEEWLLLKDDYERYYRSVKTETRKTCKYFQERIEGFFTKERGWHLDHILSISDAWRARIDPEIVGHFCNLRYIPATQNLKKNKKSDITFEKLQERINATTG